jgi:serine/threonine protein kinase
MSSKVHKLALPAGTQLQQYQIESVLGVGGFGIVYQARHTHLESLVAIKEFMPQHCATREGQTVYPLSQSDEIEFETGIQKFLDEAKQLVQFDDHPNIIRCKDFFKHNGTAYLVMNLERGKELAQILKAHTAQGSPLTEAQITKLMIPVLEGLQYIHEQGVLHRDIKPANIFVRSIDERPLLIDFGAAKQNFGHTQKSENQMQTYGYAPLEQVGSEGELGPWTDIHAVGAMMWRIVLNANPPRVEDRTARVLQGQADPALTRIDEVKGQYSENFINTIKKSIAIRVSERFQTANEVIAALQGVPVSSDVYEGTGVGLDEQQTTRIDSPDSSAHSTPGSSTSYPPHVAHIQTSHATSPPTSNVSSSAGPISSAPIPVSSNTGYQTGPTTNGAEPQSYQNQPHHRAPASKNNSFKVWVGALCLAVVVLLGVFYGLQSTDSSTASTQVLVNEEIDIVYSLVTKAEMDNDSNTIEKRMLCAMQDIDDMDEAGERNIELLRLGIENRTLNIEKNLAKARERAFDLVTRHQSSSSRIDSVFDDMISTNQQRGKYDKADYLTSLKALIQEASLLSEKSKITALLEKRITVTPTDCS